MFQKLNCRILLFIVTILVNNINAQRTDVKSYGGIPAGDVKLIYNWGEINNVGAEKTFVVHSAAGGYHFLKALSNRLREEKLDLYVNNVYIETLYPEAEGWQYLGKGIKNIKLARGKNEIKFVGNNLAIPMVEEISLTISDVWARENNSNKEDDGFLAKMNGSKNRPSDEAVLNSNDQQRVLPNPQGIYSHDINTSFSYSHFSWIYLTAGYHHFATNGSTVDRALTIFNPSNFTHSWSNVNGGPGGESDLNLYIATKGYYAIMLRPVIDGQTGITNIVYNGNMLIANAAIGGRRLAMTALRGGDMNHFTCKLNGSGTPDTRMIVSRHAMSSARGYNDDYVGNTWTWGMASRIKKTFNGVDSVQFGFVCAYSPSTTGKCDIYLGTGNNSVPLVEPANFPLLTVDDAIKSAESNGSYNCISWSGGVTTFWSWPPHQLSTYSCNGSNILQCFDNFYSNNPVRYPGAWNYTRTGATSANAVVDLWKTASAYTHASVRAPGNNHPHGYDWESKPGGLDRLFHPRNALNHPTWYGYVNDYYVHAGTFARTNGVVQNFATDVDAVKAGVAVFDVAKLTQQASEKLAKFIRNINPEFVSEFNELYAAWDKTKAANASSSNPAMYCKNKEYEALAALAKKNAMACMFLTMDKFVNVNDHIISELLLTLTLDQYRKLLDEVKQYRLTKPTDHEGRHKIHGDHDNGILFIEKILGTLEDQVFVKSETLESIQITASPNPAKDWVVLKLQLNEAAKVTIKAISAQTGVSKLILSEKQLIKGQHQFNLNVQQFGSNNGDIISIQILANGQLKTYKVLVGK